MAYDAAPSRRFATDMDGTLGYYVKDIWTEMTALSGAQMAVLNNEDDSDFMADGMSISDEGYFIYLFPQLREIDGFFASASGTSRMTATTLESSVDTTNGVDGTWVTQVADITDWDSVAINYRNEITSLALSGIKGLRVRLEGSSKYPYMKAFHVYGTFTTGQTVDRLLFLDTENADAEFSLPHDYADVSQGQTQTRTLKVKNNSATYAFTSVQITAEDLNGAMGDDFTFCLTVDGTYQSTLQISASLAAGAEVTVYVKNTTPDAETPGLWAGRIKVSHGTMV